MSFLIGKYHRGEVPDSRDVPSVEHPYHAFPCPRCGFEFVHVEDSRVLPGPYDGRTTVEVAFVCENGCEVTLIFGNYKGSGYWFWTDGIEWMEHPHDTKMGLAPRQDDLLEAVKAFPEVHPTPFHILEDNMAHRYRGTERQIRWLRGLLQRAKLDEWELIWLGVETGRLHPRRLTLEPSSLWELTRPEIGALIAFVDFLKSDLTGIGDW